MKVALGSQALNLAMAAACGVGLGLGYDLGRSLRRTFPGCALGVDFLFALGLFLVLCATSLYTGGLRIYQCLGILLGAGGYFFALSRWVLGRFCHILGRFCRIFSKFCSSMKKSLKILRKVAKKFFPYRTKWSTITGIPFSPKGRRARRESR